MAGQALVAPNQEFLGGSVAPEKPAVDPVRIKAAELYAKGYKRPQIAKMLLKWLVRQDDRPYEALIKDARSKLARWEQQASFRDLMWNNSVVQLDMETPDILKGVARKAKRGRVDAAKLALAITGRHVEKSDHTPAAITINLTGMPRPAVSTRADVEVEAVEDGG